MKKHLIKIFFLLSFITAFSQNEKAMINSIINQWHLDAAESNFSSYFNKMSSDCIFVGTDALENWTVSEFKEFSKPFFEDKNTWDFKTLERNIYSSSDKVVFWFDELLDTWMGICRGSGVIIMENKEWKIVHYVLSVVVPNENIKDVIAIKKENDDIIIDLLNEK